MSKTISIGSILVNIMANTSRFVTGVNAARKSLDSFVQGATTSSNLIKGALATIGVGFAADRVVDSLMRTTDAIDSVAETSGRLGIATEQLLGLQYGAKFAGIEADALGGHLQFLNKQIGEAIHGGDKARAVFKDLGINVRDIARAKPEQALGMIADKIMAIGTHEERLRATMRIFGDARMLTFLEQGSEGLRKFQREAESLGLTFSREQADKVAAVADQLDRIKMLLGDISTDIMIEVAPSAEKWLKGFAESVQGFKLIGTQGDMSKMPGGGLLSWMIEDEKKALEGRKQMFNRLFMRLGVGLEMAPDESKRIKHWTEKLSPDERAGWARLTGEGQRAHVDSATARLQPGSLDAAVMRPLEDFVETASDPERNRKWVRKIEDTLRDIGQTAIGGLQEAGKTIKAIDEKSRERYPRAMLDLAMSTLWRGRDTGTSQPSQMPDNPALEYGTIAAYRAALPSQQIAKGQLSEARKTNTILSTIAGTLQRSQPVAEGI